VFAASGGSAGVAKRLDVFGVVLLGCVAALGGGLLRDVVINDFPPLAFGDWRYAAVVAVGHRVGAPDLTLLITAALITFAIRMLAVMRGWSVPTAPFGRERQRRSGCR
jgi:uncharacterized membrane protein YeiH